MSGGGQVSRGVGGHSEQMQRDERRSEQMQRGEQDQRGGIFSIILSVFQWYVQAV